MCMGSFFEVHVAMAENGFELLGSPVLCVIWTPFSTIAEHDPLFSAFTDSNST